MASLSKNWITERVIDFEYKKYILLAYLMEVSNNFEVNRLYPHLADLIAHYKQLVAFRDMKQNIAENFPHRMQQVDFENFKIKYEKMVEDDAIMAEIENIISYSIPQFEHYLAEGKKIYDFIEEHLHIFPIGVMPLRPEQGYMLLKDGKSAATKVYEYQITIFEHPDTRYRGIHTTYIRSYGHSFTNTFESIKTDLLRENRNLPNPAAFAVESEMVLPMEEAMLPIAKRLLVKHVAQSGVN
jgi:hypothetical protein